MIRTFITEMESVTQKYSILPKDIINMDETAMFWEYLPQKIITQKGRKVVPSSKLGVVIIIKVSIIVNHTKNTDG